MPCLRIVRSQQFRVSLAFGCLIGPKSSRISPNPPQINPNQSKSAPHLPEAARILIIHIRLVAAVVRAGGGEQYIAPHVDFPGAPSLQHLIPEDDCAYELMGITPFQSFQINRHQIHPNQCKSIPNRPQNCPNQFESCPNQFESSRKLPSSIRILPKSNKSIWLPGGGLCTWL